jgi:hypothetical protein
MRNVACALLLAGAASLAAPKPAEAWGGGFALGTVAGLGAGAIIGSAIARPYPYAYYPYGYYPYPYAYPVPYGYAYPPVVYAPPPVVYPAPAQPATAPSSRSATYTPTQANSRPATPTCGPGQFYNTLTGVCDRR